jgi:hypothetical protein
MKGDRYMHVLSGQPAQFDPKTGQIFRGQRKIKRLCTSWTQVRRERRASTKFYRERDAKLYSVVVIPASAFDGGGQHG